MVTAAEWCEWHPGECSRVPRGETGLVQLPKEELPETTVSTGVAGSATGAAYKALHRSGERGWTPGVIETSSRRRCSVYR